MPGWTPKLKCRPPRSSRWLSPAIRARGWKKTLVSLANQDYPNLSVLVIDSASEEDPSARVAAVLPGAFVMRLERRVGFGRAANEGLKRVEGASHLLFCHDDVAFAPDAVRCLVEEAFRSNAGIATPKYLEWDHPDRLLAVGATTDKVGVVQDLIEPGELDQQQHDSVREVLLAPSGATLVRADLFRVLGGYNATIDQFGEDLDLCWRARVAGARVVAVPAARVLHLEAMRRGARPGWGTPGSQSQAVWLGDQHRIRTLLTCYRWFYWGGSCRWPASTCWVRRSRDCCRDARATPCTPAAPCRGPSAVRAGCGDPGGGSRAADGPGTGPSGGSRCEGTPGCGPTCAAGWTISATAFPSRPRRRSMETAPAPPGVIPPSTGRLPWSWTSGRTTGTAPASGARGTGWQGPVVVGAVLLAVVIFGSRGLFGHSLPAIAQLPNLSTGWSGLWRSWWATWQPAGLGVTAPSSPALALLGLLGTALFGAVGTLQHVVVLGPLVIGPLGAYRAARWWGSRRGRLAAAIAYAVVPLPYNALTRGHWPALVVYAAMPWVLSATCRLSGEVPYPPTRPERIWGRVIGLGVLVAVAGAAVPSFLYVVPLTGAALLLDRCWPAGPASGSECSASPPRPRWSPPCSSCRGPELSWAAG